MGNKSRNSFRLFLAKRGRTIDWLATEVKRRFKRNKKWTYDVIDDKIPFGINEQIVFAICLGISYKEFH